jgi:hypothetical protein
MPKFAWLAPKIGFSIKMEFVLQLVINVIQVTQMESALHATKDMT